MTRDTPFKSVSLALVAATLTYGTPRASAATDTFGGTDGSLSNSANYTTAPVATSDVLLASSPTALTLTAAGGLSVESLNVTNGSSYAITNPSTALNRIITLANSGTDAVSGTAGDLIYLADDSSLAINTTTANSRTQNVPVTLGSSGNFDVGSGSTLTIATAISSAASTVTNLNVTGGGTVILAGTDTYIGSTTIGAGSTLQFGNGGTTGGVGTNKNGGTAIVTTIADNGTLVVDRTDTVGQNADLGGAAITGTGGFTQAGTGTTQFGLANTYSGTTLISAGTLSIGNGTNNSGKISKNSAITDNSILAFNNTGATVQGTAFSTAGITGTGSVVQLGASASITTFNASNSYQGTTTVNGGTLQLANPTGAALSATSQVNINTTGTLLMGASNQLNATTPAPVQLHGAAGTGNAAALAVGGFNQGSTTASGVGMLTLASSSANNVIDFGSAAGVVTFAGLTTNGATLTISNYLNNSGAAGGSDELIFNGDQTGNLSNIVFTGYGAATEQLVSGIANTGSAFYEVFPTPVPEPGTIYGVLLMLGAAGWSQRRRLPGMRPVARQPIRRR